MGKSFTNFYYVQYIPVGIANILEPEPYMHLIQQNNAYLQLMATLLVLGFTDSMLNYIIPVNKQGHTRYKPDYQEDPHLNFLVYKKLSLPKPWLAEYAYLLPNPT